MGGTCPVQSAGNFFVVPLHFKVPLNGGVSQSCYNSSNNTNTKFIKGHNAVRRLQRRWRNSRSRPIYVQFIQIFGLSPHLYADDTRVLRSCAPSVLELFLIADFGVCGYRCGVDEVKQAIVKSRQDRGPIVYNKPPLSSSAAIDR